MLRPVPRPRSRELGLIFGSLEPGPLDAITDVEGVRVGSVTLIEGDGPLRRGEGPVRTGVTVIVPREGFEPLFAGCHRLNGNGELTGLEWIREAGCLTTPIGLTNTHSVGVVRDALVEAEVREYDEGEMFWSLPVVGETWDGTLNDINGFHVKAEHVHEALAGAADGPVPEGGVGSGTGMICHGFKGGLGTASRKAGAWTVGVLVQANHGSRERLTVGGFPVGRVLGPDVVPLPEDDPAVSGSIIVICATDAPLLPHQCDRLAQRCALGIARTGGAGEHSSGDLVLAFSTVSQGVPPGEVPVPGEPETIPITMLLDAHMDPLFYAAIEATEAAIVNALLAAETMIGRDGITAHALTAERLLDAIERVKRG
jgi:D-aminopeptidase